MADREDQLLRDDMLNVYTYFIVLGLGFFNDGEQQNQIFAEDGTLRRNFNLCSSAFLSISYLHKGCSARRTSPVF